MCKDPLWCSRCRRRGVWKGNDTQNGGSLELGGNAMNAYIIKYTYVYITRTW